MNPFEQARRTVQFLSTDAVQKANSGHPGTPMALAGIGVELFTQHLRYNPEDPAWPNRDRFVLSCGHASMLLYSLLHLAGFGLAKDELVNFRQWNSKTPGHPEYGHAPGVETTTGPLGQGIGNAVGMALAGKLLGARVNSEPEPLIDYNVYVLASDGDLMEGVGCEAVSLAGHLGLDNLIVVYDDNHITIDGRTDLSFSENVGKRFEACGWDVQEIDGHDSAAVKHAIERAKSVTGKPAMIVARTIIGIGAPNKQDTSAAHGAPLGEDEIRAAKEAAGWPVEPPFYTPEEAYQPFRDHVARTKPSYDAWQARIASLPEAEKQRWTQLTSDQVPANLFEELLAAFDGKDDATRNISNKIQQRAAQLVPALVGGAADLAGSVKSKIKDGGDVRAGAFEGRNLYFGVREHAMGSIANGLALSGFIPYTGTFLIFSDYMRPTLRLAALMGQRVIEIFSHDSIYLGEDGPTHQPVEQVNSLRLIPGLHVCRPADGLETAACWAYAIERSAGPTALCTTRQTLPTLKRPAGFDPKSLLEGAYILRDADSPTLVIIATGSEVQVAVGAADLLEAKGQRVRVVSAPCLDRFTEQPLAKQQAVLGKGIRRVSIEAGTTALWRGIVGLDGICVGLDHFGASAPAKKLQQEFGFTAEQVAERVLSEL